VKKATLALPFFSPGGECGRTIGPPPVAEAMQDWSAAWPPLSVAIPRLANAPVLRLIPADILNHKPVPARWLEEHWRKSTSRSLNVNRASAGVPCDMIDPTDYRAT
jgi:hypothetical protein